MSDIIDVIEVRKARNGYVLSAYMRPWGAKREPHMLYGYATYVVASEDPAAVGQAVERALRDFPISNEVPIPPSRELP